MTTKLMWLLTVAVFVIGTGCGVQRASELTKLPSSDVTIVYITDQTLKEIGSFPLTRDRYGAFIDAVYTNYNPKCVYVDLLITTPSKETPEGDTTLVESVKGRENLAFCSALGENAVAHSRFSTSTVAVSGHPAAVNAQGAILPLPEMVSNGAIASISSIFPNSQGLMDSCPTLFDIADNWYLSTPLVLATRFLDMPWSSLSGDKGTLTVDGHSVDVDSQGQLPINFKHRFLECQYSDVVSGRAPGHLLDGKIIILGVAYTGSGDVLATPVETRMRGAEYIAHATQTIIDLLRSPNAVAQASRGH